MSLNIQLDKFVYHSDSETTIIAYFPSKSLKYTAINLFLQKWSNLTIAKITICTRTDITLKTSVKYLKAITMSSAFTPDCRCYNSTIVLIGDVYCPNTKSSINFACTKRLFNLSAEAIINIRNAQLCASFPFDDQTNSFFLSLGQGVYNFDGSPKSVQDVIGDVYFAAKLCSSRENCEALGGYVTTPRSI